jgi:hypothetical protein
MVKRLEELSQEHVRLMSQRADEAEDFEMRLNDVNQRHRTFVVQLAAMVGASGSVDEGLPRLEAEVIQIMCKRSTEGAHNGVGGALTTATTSPSQIEASPVTGVPHELVEEILEKLVDAHRKEVANATLTNQMLRRQLRVAAGSRPSAPKHCTPGQHVAGLRQKMLHVLRMVGMQRRQRYWGMWKLWREQKRRERITDSANVTISRIQGQQMKLKDLASALMNRVKELEAQSRV